PWNIIAYNVFGGKDRGPDVYGTEPWHYYIVNGLLNFNIMFIMALISLPGLFVTILVDNRRISSSPTAVCLNAAIAIFLVRGWIDRFLSALSENIPYAFNRRCYLKCFTFSIFFISGLISISRVFALYYHYNAPMAIYKHFYYVEIPQQVETQKLQLNLNNPINLCIGKEWYRFPSHYFLPDGVRLRFLKSDFNGQLPKYFLEDTQIDSESRTKMNYKRDGTWMLQEGFNDINKEEMDRYVDIDQCDYIVDLETNYTQASANEPRYVTQTDKWNEVICKSFLDAANSDRFSRAFYFPPKFWQGMKMVISYLPIQTINNNSAVKKLGSLKWGDYYHFSKDQLVIGIQKYINRNLNLNYGLLKIMSTTEELQTLVLTTLDVRGTIPNTKDLVASDNKEVDQLALLGALKSLSIVDKEMVKYETIEEEVWMLTDEGNEIANKGSHEAKVFDAIPIGEEGIAISALHEILGETAKIGQGKAFKNKWITKKGDNLVRAIDSIIDQTRIDLEVIRSTGTHSDPKVLTELRKRKLCDKHKVISYSVSKGPKFSLTIEKQARDVTFEMLQRYNGGEWKKANFKKYNFDALGIPPSGGHLHPLMKPQQHPARDAHDTFFLKDPAICTQFPTEYLERVKEVHSVGGYGSTGYGYDWKIEEAQKLILRTHTTAVSSFMLYNLAKQKEFKPVKYFSIDRVFRNETVDATHLAEFHQVEGVIADKGLTLGDLIGFMNTFFNKMGVKNLRFKPAYNPYTEPSLGKWVEIGNSGMFRPEMLEPMGLDPDVRVIAWGLSLERPTMIKYGINNIRE
ncbi:18096_t:CDS:10, partial [Racocetra persica]